MPGAVFGEEQRPWREEDIVITVKTYPSPSQKDREVSCVAGITSAGEWIRLFPVPFRLLPETQKFKRFQVVRAQIRRASDRRRESHHIKAGSIRVIGRIDTMANWAHRNKRVLPLLSNSLEDLQNQNADSLGIIRVARLDRLRIVSEQEGWSPAELAKLTRAGLTDPTIKLLECPAHAFYYEFHCEGAVCRGHKLKLMDWEVIETYRSWTKKYGPHGWEAKFREKYELEFREKKDLCLFVGTMKAHPKAWMAIGVYYPPKGSTTQVANEQLSLFAPQ